MLVTNDAPPGSSGKTERSIERSECDEFSGEAPYLLLRSYFGEPRNAQKQHSQFPRVLASKDIQFLIATIPDPTDPPLA